MWLVVALVLGALGENSYAPLSWGIGVQTFDAAALGLGTTEPVMPDVPDVARLTLPTYDFSGQGMHPDVLVDGDRVLIAMTPYPFADARHENPSLLAGDGVHFETLTPSPV